VEYCTSVMAVLILCGKEDTELQKYAYFCWRSVLMPEFGNSFLPLC